MGFHVHVDPALEEFAAATDVDVLLPLPAQTHVAIEAVWQEDVQPGPRQELDLLEHGSPQSAQTGRQEVSGQPCDECQHPAGLARKQDVALGCSVADTPGVAPGGALVPHRPVSSRYK